jgi:hypothetical protein
MSQSRGFVQVRTIGEVVTQASPHLYTILFDFGTNVGNDLYGWLHMFKVEFSYCHGQVVVRDVGKESLALESGA